MSEAEIIVIPFKMEHLQEIPLRECVQGRMDVMELSIRMMKEQGYWGYTALLDGRVAAIGLVMRSPSDPGQDGIASIFLAPAAREKPLQIVRLAKKYLPLMAQSQGLGKLYATVTGEWQKWIRVMGFTVVGDYPNPFDEGETVILCERRF